MTTDFENALETPLDDYSSIYSNMDNQYLSQQFKVNVLNFAKDLFFTKNKRYTYESVKKLWENSCIKTFENLFEKCDHAVFGKNWVILFGKEDWNFFNGGFLHGNQFNSVDGNSSLSASDLSYSPRKYCDKLLTVDGVIDFIKFIQYRFKGCTNLSWTEKYTTKDGHYIILKRSSAERPEIYEDRLQLSSPVLTEKDETLYVLEEDRYIGCGFKGVRIEVRPLKGFSKGAYSWEAYANGELICAGDEEDGPKPLNAHYRMNSYKWWYWEIVNGKAGDAIRSYINN